MGVDVNMQDCDHSLAATQNTKRHSVIRNNEHGMIEVGWGGAGAQNCNDIVAATENTQTHCVIRGNDHHMKGVEGLKAPSDTVLSKIINMACQAQQCTNDGKHTSQISAWQPLKMPHTLSPVSYTHLTLPTKVNV